MTAFDPVADTGSALAAAAGRVAADLGAHLARKAGAHAAGLGLGDQPRI